MKQNTQTYTKYIQNTKRTHTRITMASIAKDANNNSNNNNKIVEQHHKDLNNMVEIYENQTNGEIKYTPASAHARA